MNFFGIILFFLTFSLVGNAHNVKLLKSQSPDLDTSGLDASFNNESYIGENDSFFEGSFGVSRSKNSYDDSSSETKNFGLQALTPGFISFGLNTSLYDNTSEELKTRTAGIELGKKFFYGNEDADGFKSNFGVKIKGDRVTLEQSKTFVRRKFDFNLEQTSTGVSLSLNPIRWLELSGAFYRNKYNKDISTIKSNLSRSEFIGSLFSNVQNTLSSLSDSSETATVRFIPDTEFDVSFSRTYSDDLISETQYFVDVADVGIYYFSRVHIFVTAGEQYSSVNSSKSTFNEFSLQINF